ncbi:unnamed protein product [Cylindrotheca closterium]|uniref:Protochlorophyllide reductase n=1 Tax=Cylindrotheca closterium TaxID=2856 RepID=A0AAD2CL87_9STRA|nr:unnamed protein product [Cylindrotheca closterium]
MSSAKKILITGSTDGLGLEAAKKLVQQGHSVLLHGRSKQKLADTYKEVKSLLQSEDQVVESYRADLSKLSEVAAMAEKVKSEHSTIDVLINNAGIFKTPQTKTESGMDVRFMVNTIAPYLLTKQLLTLVPEEGRIVNLSSAAQAPVGFRTWSDPSQNYDDFDAYAQSKLGIIMWSNHLASSLQKQPMIVSLNPASLLGTKMVREGFNTMGKDVNIGVNIIIEAALGESFANASGKYWDNDNGRFAPPGSDASDPGKCAELVEAMETIIARELGE